MGTSHSRWMRRFGLLLCLGLTLDAGAGLAAPAKGKGKGKKAVVGSKNSALANALNDRGNQVQQCAVENGLEKGAKKADIAVRVTINNKGEVVDNHITVNLDGGGDSKKIEECVDKLVRSAKFPTITTPMATAERSWSVAQQ